jgi:peptidoglycan LD-endopeptidase LytH
MSAFADILRRSQSIFHRVVPFTPEKEKLLQIDFTRNNKELTDEMVSDTRKFTDYMNQKLRLADAKFAIGGYLEVIMN